MHPLGIASALLGALLGAGCSKGPAATPPEAGRLAVVSARSGTSAPAAGPADAGSTASEALGTEVGPRGGRLPSGLSDDPFAGPDTPIPDQLEDLYPIFCVRRSMAVGEKAALWRARYMHRWVRWTGILQSYTPNGVTLKTHPLTSTYDVSLRMPVEQIGLLKQRFRRGDRLTYLGRLESYDDVFRTFYLSQGAVLASSDAGAP